MGMDFNDLEKERGLKAVADQVKPVIDAAKGEPYGNFIIKSNAVYQLSENPKTGEVTQYKFCSYIKPIGLARDESDGSYTALLDMKNPYDHLKTLQIPMEDVYTSGAQEALRLFVGAGGRFYAKSRIKSGFPELISSFFENPDKLKRILLAEKTGWIERSGQRAFVLPGETIGSTTGEQIRLKDQGEGPPTFQCKGTLQDWQENIGRYCVGNSRLTYSASLSLAAPLFRLRGAGGAGSHFFGKSSSGKTTLLHTSASVSGFPEGIIKTFNSTANALEHTASQFNDCLLPVDELGQGDPQQAGRIVYTTMDGVGRGRADIHGNARKVRYWTIALISTGEIDIEAHLASGGQTVKAGQEIRLACIPADAEQGLGIFETIHEFDSPAEFADHLKAASGKYHGVLFHQYIKTLVDELNDPEKCESRMEWIANTEQDFINQVVPPGASGQVYRVSRRFALAATAGELATSYGLTGWTTGEATSAAKICFKAWLERRGTSGDSEVMSLLNQVNGFFESFGESRFQPIENKGRDIPRRAGFRRAIAEGMNIDPTGYEYYVLPETWRKEVTAGYESRWAAKVLVQYGILQESPKGESTQTKRLPGLGNKRCYVIEFNNQEIETETPKEACKIDEYSEVPF